MKTRKRPVDTWAASLVLGVHKNHDSETDLNLSVFQIHAILGKDEQTMYLATRKGHRFCFWVERTSLSFVRQFTRTCLDKFSLPLCEMLDIPAALGITRRQFQRMNPDDTIPSMDMKHNPSLERLDGISTLGISKNTTNLQPRVG
ncbi:hypothetical protein Plhal304r1_c029g0095181 [Plasmopara halstedii]